MSEIPKECPQQDVCIVIRSGSEQLTGKGEPKRKFLQTLRNNSSTMQKDILTCTQKNKDCAVMPGNWEHLDKPIQHTLSIDTEPLSEPQDSFDAVIRDLKRRKCAKY